MQQLLAIAKNTFLQTVRQPTYGIIVLVTLGGLALAPSLTGWTLDDDDKMLRDIGLSTLLIQGLFLACFTASSVINTEIEEKVVLTSVVKPISRFAFILGKYLGVLGAVAAAQYLAGAAIFMMLRHGVMQTASDTLDMTVVIFGPIAVVFALAAATALNYVFDWRFLPAFLTLIVPLSLLGLVVQLTLGKDWKPKSYEITQTMDNLPSEVMQEGTLRGIVEFRPLEGHGTLTGNRGLLVHKILRGPINDDDRDYLMNLSDMAQWKKDVNFLVIETRKHQGPEIFKAGVLVFGAVAVLTSIAVMLSTRWGMIATYVGSIFATCVGLTVDHYQHQIIHSRAPGWMKTAVEWVYPVIPNFQMFWMIDALSEDRIIPWNYVANAYGYAALCIAAFLLAAGALFETREVG